jgi:hypothetical protein
MSQSPVQSTFWELMLERRNCVNIIAGRDHFDYFLETLPFRMTNALLVMQKKNQAIMNLTNTVLKFSDPMVQTDMQHWSIKTICDDSDCHVKEVE